MSEDISRDWWIGYILAWIGGISAIALAAWFFLIRPEMPTPPPPEPVALVDAPPLKFMLAKRPGEPAVLELLEKFAASVRALPPCRVETEWVNSYYSGATPEKRRASGGRVLGKGTIRWLIKGDWYRKESKISISDPHPDVDRPSALRLGAHEQWEVFNDKLFAGYYSGEEFISACPRRLLTQDAVITRMLSAAELLDGFRLNWARPGRGVELKWSVRTEGKFVIIAGDPIPGAPHQHIRCELALDPGRDYLLRRVSFWMNDALYSERRIEIEQLPDGRWFPKRSEMRYRDTVAVEEYTSVEMDAQIDDKEFQTESIPCDLETVLMKQRKGEGPFNHDYFKFIDGQWQWVSRPLNKGAMPDVTVEWADSDG